MKIALLIHELLVQGGAERQFVSLARALTKIGHEVTVYTSACNTQNCYQEICADLDIRVTGRGLFPGISRPSFLRRYLDMRSMASKIREPYQLWNPHHWPPHWASVWLKRKLGGKVVWMCNDVPDLKQKGQDSRARRSLLKSLCYHLLYRYDAAQIREIDLIAVLSNLAKSQFLQLYSGRLKVIRSGIDSDRFLGCTDRKTTRRKFGLGMESFVILWFGIFMPHRRLEDAITAVALLRARDVDVCLWLAGCTRSFPEYANRLRRMVCTLGLADAVIFADMIPEPEVASCYAACDVFLSPNENQTWGLAVIEAMAAGRPVIVSTGSGVHEVLKDGTTALFVPPRDPAAIAAKVELLVRDPSLRGNLGRQGRQYVLERFSWERYASDMESLFAEAVSV